MQMLLLDVLPTIQSLIISCVSRLRMTYADSLQRCAESLAEQFTNAPGILKLFVVRAMRVASAVRSVAHHRMEVRRRFLRRKGIQVTMPASDFSDGEYE